MKNIGLIFSVLYQSPWSNSGWGNTGWQDAGAGRGWADSVTPWNDTWRNSPTWKDSVSWTNLSVHTPAGVNLIFLKP